MPIIQEKQEQIQKLKMAYCDSLFVKDQTGFYVKCTNSNLSNFYKKLYNKYPKKLEWQEFLGECMYYTYKAIMNFDILDEGNWNGIIDNSDKPNTGRLITYIINTVGKKIYQYVANGDKLFTRAEVNGKKGQHVMIEMNVVSLDSIITGENGESTTLEKIITNDQNFMCNTFYYCWNYYLQWFNANKARILTKNQLNYLEHGHPCSKKNKRIRERVTKAWEQENPLHKKTLLEVYKENELKVWHSIFQLIYDESIEINELNAKMTEWIARNLDIEFVSNLVYDSLDGSESRFIVGAYDYKTAIPNKVLYKIVNAIEQRIIDLNKHSIQPIKFFKHENEKNGWTLERHQQYEQYLAEFKNQKCYVYDSNGKVKTIKQEEKRKTTNIIQITPTGTELLKQVD